MDIVYIDVYGDVYTVEIEGDKIVSISCGRKEGKEITTPFAEKVKKEFEEFFAGKRKDFDLEILVQGTAFEKRVYEEMMRIPYGLVMSYGDLAEMAGYPRAARAVGTACAKNNIPFIIPCHRVVARNSMGGYGLGRGLKVKLLEMERLNA